MWRGRREKGGWCRGLLQLCRYECLNGKIPPDATGAAHQVSFWLMCRAARFQSFIHGLAWTARSRYPPPVKFCHRTSTVISFGPCSGDISVMQEFGVHTPVICFKADLLDWGNPYVNSALFIQCVQAYSFEITSVKRPGCFGNAVKTESGPSRFSLLPSSSSSSSSSSSFSTLVPVSAQARGCVTNTDRVFLNQNQNKLSSEEGEWPLPVCFY